MKDLKVEEIRSMTALQLKNKLIDLDLNSEGRKAELISRLEYYFGYTSDQQSDISEEEQTEQTEQTERDIPDDHPMSEDRLKKRAAKFGLPEPRHKKLAVKSGISKQKDGDSIYTRRKFKSREPIHQMVQTDEDLAKHAARAKRFASSFDSRE